MVSTFDKARANNLPTSYLRQIAHDTTQMAERVPGLVGDNSVDMHQLYAITQCTGVTLKGKIDAMIRRLESARSRLDQDGGGISVSAPMDVIRRQSLRADIDERLDPLRETSQILYDVTVAINGRILASIG